MATLNPLATLQRRIWSYESASAETATTSAASSKKWSTHWQRKISNRTGQSMSSGGQNSESGFWSIIGCWTSTLFRFETRTGYELETVFSVQADTELVFTNRNKLLFVELPNRQCIKATVNFSSDVLSVVRDICYLCEIRHHTELSLIRSKDKVKVDAHAYQTLDGTQTPTIQLNNSQQATGQPVYSTMRSPGRHGSKNDPILNSGTRLIDVSNKEYKKLSAPGSTLDPEKLEPPKASSHTCT